jgi:hypothetical protein
MTQRPPILKPNESYTFGSYFLMKFAPGDILRELGASLTKGTINLPVEFRGDECVIFPTFPELNLTAQQIFYAGS